MTDENSTENLIFYKFFEKLLLQIEPSEITSFFYSKVFGFGRISPFPLATPLWGAYFGRNIRKNFKISKIFLFIFSITCQTQNIS